jgi:ribonuclease HI
MIYRKSSLKITCYVDASYGGDGIDYRSTTGYLIYLGNNSVIWKSSKQKTTALSTAEAEIIAVRECLKDALWLRGIIKELKLGEQPITIKEDNQACIKLCEKQVINTKVKHIAIAISFIREQVENGIANFEYCPTNDMIADV